MSDDVVGAAKRKANLKMAMLRKKKKQEEELEEEERLQQQNRVRLDNLKLKIMKNAALVQQQQQQQQQQKNPGRLVDDLKLKMLKKAGAAGQRAAVGRQTEQEASGPPPEQVRSPAAFSNLTFHSRTPRDGHLFTMHVAVCPACRARHPNAVADAVLAAATPQ